MEAHYLITFFLFGLIFGSFFNVVGYRLPRGESIVNPPSHCPKCDQRLTARELVPLFSYLWQRGRCIHCQQKIAPFYAIFEFLTGVLFALSYYVFGLSFELIVAILFSSMTIILIVSDWHYLILPDEVLLIILILLSIVVLLSSGVMAWLLALFNGIIAFTIMYLIKIFGDFVFKRESMGGGDIKLMLIFGFILGYELAIVTIALAAFIGLPASLLIILKKEATERIIPFGPFLCVAALILFFFQLTIDDIFNFVMEVRLF